MKLIKRLAVVSAVFGAAVGLVGCGSESPFAATSVNGSNIVLRGTVLNLVPALAVGFSASSTSAVGFSASSTSTDGVITVTVDGYPEITTEVDSEGEFILRGLPEGSFTLVFTDANGVDLQPLLTFEGVKPNQELIVSVELMDDGTVVLVEEQRNGIGHAGLEIQGSIDQVPDGPDLNGDYLFMIAGYQVVVRLGVTAIREDNTHLEWNDLAAGDQVHVTALWLELEPGVHPADQQVLAYQIKLQDGDADADADGEKVNICHKGKNTLSVGAGALAAHLAHGDTMGGCP